MVDDSDMSGSGLSCSTPLYQASRNTHGIGEAASPRHALPGNPKGCTMIGTCANERQPERNIYRLVKIDNFQRSQPLVVIQRHHHVELTPQRAREQRVARFTQRKARNRCAQTEQNRIEAVPFLGGHLMLPTGPMKLSQATGAPIVPIFSIRRPGGKLDSVQPSCGQRMAKRG